LLHSTQHSPAQKIHWCIKVRRYWEEPQSLSKDLNAYHHIITPQLQTETLQKPVEWECPCISKQTMLRWWSALPLTTLN
jgi:hypothetical protein